VATGKKNSNQNRYVTPLKGLKRGVSITEPDETSKAALGIENNEHSFEYEPEEGLD